jgi:hypothetical protein
MITQLVVYSALVCIFIDDVSTEEVIQNQMGSKHDREWKRILKSFP